MDKAAVASNQRARLYGAMAHSIAVRGFQTTTVADVIRLAGVSRTTFYEHFANKSDCFLAAYETMAYRMIKNIHSSHRSGGDWLGTLSDVFDALRREVLCETSAARMILFEAGPAGPDAVQRSRKVRSVFDQMLQQILSMSPARQDVSKTLVRAITGGIRGVLRPRLYPGNTAELSRAADELAAWALAYHAPEAEVGRRVDQLRLLSDRRRALDAMRQQSSAGASAGPQGGLATLARSAPARLTDRRHPVLERFPETAERGARPPAWVGRAPAVWPLALRETIGGLTHFVAANPQFGHLSLTEISMAGPDIGGRAYELFGELKCLLARGPELCGGGISPIICEAVAAAVWSTIRHEASSERVRACGEVSDELTRIALTPFIGSHEAKRALTGACGSATHARTAVA